jgi:hypothetical protein
MSELAESVMIMIFSNRFDISMPASAVAEVGMSIIMSTPSFSYHFRAIAAAMSALFSTSAVTSSIGLPRTELPTSSIAILVAPTLPMPPMSE